MKSFVQTGPESCEIRERERPEPDSGEVLLRVRAAGLCGSDVHAFEYADGYEFIPFPRIMGHEYAGEIVETGSNVEQFAVGDKVVEEPIHDCGDCFQCKNGQPNTCKNSYITGMHGDGAFTEYTIVAERHLHGIPDSVPYDHAAITEPTSIAARAVLERSVGVAGDTVLVEGPGPIGALIAAIAHEIGLNVLVSGMDRDEAYRLPLVEKFGVETVNVDNEDLAKRTDEFTDGIGFDVVFDATGHASGLETAAQNVRKGGQAVVVGLPASPSELFVTPLVRGEVDVTTSYGSTWRNFEQALRMMSDGNLNVDTITDGPHAIDEIEETIHRFQRGETCKPILKFENT
jgi:L-iditol 2-dehydrogenase